MSKNENLEIHKTPNAGLQFLVEMFEQTHSAMQTQAARSVDIALVVRNWLFGWYIIEFEGGGADRADLYGKNLINLLSQQLNALHIKGMSPTNLRKFREFYSAYSKIRQAAPVTSFLEQLSLRKVQQAMPVKSSGTIEIPALMPVFNALKQRFKLGWTHYVTLLSIKNPDERSFYEIESIENNWGYRELGRQINASLFERLALSRNKDEIKSLSRNGQIVEKPRDIIKNPYILEFTDLEERTSYSENDLETALINRLEQFLLELGKGFLFEARQKRFSFDNNHFYVDLVFYNRLLRSYVLIDLKIGDLKHQDLGQMQMYVNYFDRFIKTDTENPTIGILLCHSKQNELVELTLPKGSNIYASEYMLYLPSKEELKSQLEDVQRDWDNRHG